MASIKILSQSIDYIGANKYFIKFDIETNVKPNTSFNLTRNHKKPVNLIVSPHIYHGLQSDICTRTNSNTHEIKIYGYHGGKELSRVVPGCSKMGNITYPEISYSLLSQIVFPSPEPNTHYILAIDSLPALLTIEHELLKKELFEQDSSMFIESLTNFVKSTNPIGSTVELVILKDNHSLSAATSSIASTCTVDSNKIVRFLGDTLYGRIFGGTQTIFSTIISLESSAKQSDIKLITVFSQLNKEFDFKHEITVRGSGIVISGNTTSSIGMIVETPSDNIKLVDINTGTEICNFSTTDVEIRPQVSKINQYIKILEYIGVLEKIDFNNKDQEKAHMKTHRDFIELIEYSEFEDFYLLDDKFSSTINKHICQLIKFIKVKWFEIRSKFGCSETKSYSNKLLPTTRAQNMDFTGLEYQFSVAQEFTPGVPARQYSQHVDKRVTFDELN